MSVENKMESLMSSKHLCQARTQAVKVLQLGDFTRTNVSQHPRTDNVQNRGGLKRPKTD